jgi:hypothetical protein
MAGETDDTEAAAAFLASPLVQWVRVCDDVIL